MAARDQELISLEVYDAVLAAMESAEAVLNERRIQLEYSTITAPFDGVIVERAVRDSENLTANQRMFRVSDFNPLLCPIQVPEKELPNLRIGQPGYVTVEAWPDQQFSARVLRISPVVDATSGTVKVTLEISSEGKLRPGMFTSVFLVIDTHDDAIVIPKQALSLESLADTVYIAGADNVASRRDVTLGFEEADVVEVTRGLAEGEHVIIVGQDGLSDGTPINVLAGGLSPAGPEGQVGQVGQAESAGRGGGARGGRGPVDPEQMRARMKERGMSDEQIEERLKQMQERQAGAAPPNPPNR
jgi:membrane fusion protein (multidrug efflux system)